MESGSILVINTGSSSLKLGLYHEQSGGEQLALEASADGIGQTDGSLTLRDAAGHLLRSERLASATQKSALGEVVGWLRELAPNKARAIGHRVVHGGPRLTTHQRITPGVLRELRESVHFAPLHIPAALDLIEAAGTAYPDVPQFACFDTAFHRTLPELASRFPLPAELFERGIRRYGFHGLSYESITFQLGSALPERTIIAHLGSGASLAAVRSGRSVDTSMGLTPTGGVVMATRSGDLDPGLLLYLLRTSYPSADALETLLNHNAGLYALSGGASDMRAIEAAMGRHGTKEDGSAEDGSAQLAFEIFCASVRKTVAAYTAVLGGLDLLVFTGGIGEHSARVRAEVCRNLEFFGIGLDDASNLAHAETLSISSSKVRVMVLPSQEDLQIARHCRALMKG